MEQNTVIIGTEEYNRLRDGYQKWKDMKATNEMNDTLNQEKWKQWYDKQLEDKIKLFEWSVNKLTEGTHTTMYLGKAPEYIDKYQFSARHVYEVVTIGTEANELKVQEPTKKRRFWGSWLK